MSKNKLTPYVRLDGNGKLVPSSVIMRKNKPVNGRFKPIINPSSSCCPLIPLITEIQDFSAVPNPLEYQRINFRVTDSNGTVWIDTNYFDMGSYELPAGTYTWRICRSALAIDPLLTFETAFSSATPPGTANYFVPTTVSCITTAITVVEPLTSIILTVI